MESNLYNTLMEVKDILMGVRHGHIKNYYEFNEIFSILDANIGRLSDKKRYKSIKKNIIKGKISSNDFIIFLNKEIEIAEHK